MQRLPKHLLRAIYRQIAILGAPFMLAEERRARFREFFDQKIIELFRDKIEAFIEAYPEVWTEEQTIDYIIQHKASICRFGDGELKLMVGERHKSFQDINPTLNRRLK